jgi:hypothetical protein
MPIGDSDMREHVYLGAILALICFTGWAFAQETQAGDGNATIEPLSLQGIWTVSLAGTEITMSLNQSGDSVFGQCKFEGEEPWNGVVAGSVSGRAVHIAMAAMRGEVLATTMMSGTAEGDSITGSYVRADDEGSAAKGEFQATKISADASIYTPAEVLTASAQPVQEVEQPEPVQSTASEETSDSISQSRYTDVNTLKNSINPLILPRHAPL